MLITDIPITAIEPYPNNARRNENTIQKVRESIEEYGFNVPLIVDENYIIVAGHTRFEALKQIHSETGEYAEIPCTIMTGNPELIKEYRLMDNRISDLSFWDNTKLTLEIKAFEDISTIEESFGTEIANMAKDTMGESIKDITEADIEKTADRLEHTYTDEERDRGFALFKCNCAGCGEEFSLRIGDV